MGQTISLKIGSTWTAGNRFFSIGQKMRMSVTSFLAIGQTIGMGEAAKNKKGLAIGFAGATFLKLVLYCDFLRQSQTTIIYEFSRVFEHNHQTMIRVYENVL